MRSPSRESEPDAARRAHALQILEAGLAAVAPVPVTRAAVEEVLRGPVRGRVIVVGAGKAAALMVRGASDAFAEVLGSEWHTRCGGVVVAPPSTPQASAVDGSEENDVSDRRSYPISLAAGGHPLPNEDGARAARSMLDLVGTAQEGDLVLVLLSGGASALMSLPAEGLSLADLQRTSEVLLGSGADIGEVNTVRKHLSAVAGGRLGERIGAARGVALVISDVVGDSLTAIGSGPAFGDPTTFAEALTILQERRIESDVPAAVLSHLKAGARGDVAETPSPEALAHVEHRIIARNLDACRAMAGRAERLGYDARVLSDMIEGEARDVGIIHAGLAASAARHGLPSSPPCALVTGGEATVTLRGRGKGGRNQESALAAVPRLDGLPATFLSAGTDGVDGVTDAAGGVVDGRTAGHAKITGVDIGAALAENDSNRALERLDALVHTGPTGTNVADVRVILVGGKED